METLLLIGFIALLFYIVLPGFGAFYVRSQWRRFRTLVVASSLYPLVRYEHLRQRESGYIGKFRFFGVLEAIQEDQIWVRNGNITLSARLEMGPVYILPSFSAEEKVYEQNEETLPDEAPAKIQWKKIFSLPRGTKMLIAGPLYLRKGQGTFQTGEEGTTMVMIYDGGAETILRRSIWGGRQRNEYWNLFTPGSLTLGSFASFIYGYTLFRESLQRIPALLSLSMSLVPIIMLVPPGLFFFFLYRSFWKQGRFYRAERDILLLPLRYFSEPECPHGDRRGGLPDGSPYSLRWYQKKQEIPVELYAGGATIRTTTLLKTKDIESEGWYVFGFDADQKNDPMAELVIIPGNPKTLSRRCRDRARMYEFLSVLLFASGLFINFIGAFLVLSRFIG
jgi:hypothetical protein